MTNNNEYQLIQSARHLADLARTEDLGPDNTDLTSQLLPNDSSAEYQLLIKQKGVFAGQAITQTILNVFDDSLQINWHESTTDGIFINDPPHAVATITGPRASILTAERTLLNFLQRLSGIATLTRQFVDAIAHTEAKIHDTRKTIPGWRLLEKYAVRCGGGQNHRFGLHDAVLIKDNHLVGVPVDRLANHVFQMLNHIETLPAKPAFTQIEVDNLDQFQQLLDIVGIDIILLDNFSIQDMISAVRMRNDRNLQNKLSLEASGGITLETIRPIAETGIDRISTGAITHSAPALDISLDI